MVKTEFNVFSSWTVPGTFSHFDLVQDSNIEKIKLGYETLEKMKSMLDEEVDHKLNQYIR